MTLRKITHIFTIAFLASTLLFSVSACKGLMKDNNMRSEINDPDYPTLLVAKKEYKKGKADESGRETSSALIKFRGLTQAHSDDLIGEESLFYVGRIYYDMRDYHDARITFMRFRENYPESEFLPTIDLLDEEMKKDLGAYKTWVGSRQTSSGGY